MSPAPAYVPERGDVVRVSFSPQAGHEQAGRRPGLVISPSSYNGPSGLALICPLTNKRNGYAFEVPIPAGLAVTGVVLADHVKCLDWRARRAVYLTQVPWAVTNAVMTQLAGLVT